MVVTCIIGVLAAVALMNMAHALRKAREGRTYSHLSTTRTAIATFYATAGLTYTYLPPGANPVGSFPYALKEGGYLCPPAQGENWAGGPGDPSPFEVEKGAYLVFFNKYIDHIPDAEVSDNGAWGFGDGNVGMGAISSGIWESNMNANPLDATIASPNGNYRGWHYRNTDGIFRINNTSLSTEGKRYDKY
jgi:type II secretory pathway pseudopilin PulG